MLVRKIKENRPISWQSRRSEDNIKIDFVETECEIMLDPSGSKKWGVCENIYEFFSSSIMGAVFLVARTITGLRSSTALYCIEW